MKRILIIVAILVLLPVAGWGQHWALMGGDGIQLLQSNETNNADVTLFNDDASDFIYGGVQWSLTNSAKITRIELLMRKANTPTGAITISIYTDVGDNPGVLVGASTNTLPMASLTLTNAWYTFYFDNVAVSANTRYWLVMSGALQDSGDSVSMRYDSSASIGLYNAERSADFVAWGVLDADCKLTHRMYGY